MIFDSSASALELNNDLAKIDRWIFQLQMAFNPDPKKQAQDVIFSRKSRVILHPSQVFNNNNNNNNNNVIKAANQKHLGIVLDTPYI